MHLGTGPVPDAEDATEWWTFIGTDVLAALFQESDSALEKLHSEHGAWSIAERLDARMPPTLIGAICWKQHYDELGVPFFPGLVTAGLSSAESGSRCHCSLEVDWLYFQEDRWGGFASALGGDGFGEVGSGQARELFNL